uniref:PHD-type domain-containing protein n=1 Tax=Scylla olivacea TaxID=85551 RepID=A0A0P4WGW0_SCYOL
MLNSDCTVCNRGCTRSKAMTCETCGNWYHAACVSHREALMKLLWSEHFIFIQALYGRIMRRNAGRHNGKEEKAGRSTENRKDRKRTRKPAQAWTTRARRKEATPHQQDPGLDLKSRTGVRGVTAKHRKQRPKGKRVM